ncbi:WGR domain-containing protein [Pseudotabrizicola sp. 4114]|uniref:WGR domain-containing protein n=1 Tax=Pseudotabrizicola sp. 4114 TaxID=2817731 RepID=UPI0032B74A09
MHCHLEQRQPDLNRQRFYAVAVEQDLFGQWLLLRRWGRIGTCGRGLVEAFAAQDMAQAAALDLIRIKTRRGYGPARQRACSARPGRIDNPAPTRGEAKVPIFGLSCALPTPP